MGEEREGGGGRSKKARQGYREQHWSCWSENCASVSLGPRNVRFDCVGSGGDRAGVAGCHRDR